MKTPRIGSPVGCFLHRDPTVNLVTSSQASLRKWTYWARCLNRTWLYFHPHIQQPSSWNANSVFHHRGKTLPQMLLVLWYSFSSTKSPFENLPTLLESFFPLILLTTSFVFLNTYCFLYRIQMFHFHIQDFLLIFLWLWKHSSVSSFFFISASFLAKITSKGWEGAVLSA